MDTISSTQNSSPAAAALSATAEEEAEAASAISSDFETFLRMLTVQLQNQDPLNPVESTDFAVQLATFSGVEQQVRTNDLLESMAGQQTGSELSELASWVGMEARAPVSASYSGEPVTFYVDPAVGADQATLVVRNSSGLEVSRSALQPSAKEGTWSGTDSNGAKVVEGSYDLAVEYRAAGQLMSTETAEIYGPITEARMGGSEPLLVFGSGDEVSTAEVSAIRVPSN